MKLITRNTLLFITIALAYAFVTTQLNAQVYKTVDENGNVTYTDQPPKDGSHPITLKPISVIEAPTYEAKTPAGDSDVTEEEAREKPLRFLRKHYEDFEIVSPKNEESIWYTEGVITVAWGTGNPVEPGMQVTISVDGASQPPTGERVLAIEGLERGEHTVTAELKDARNRSIATAAPVIFFIRQPNIYSNKPRPTPRSGG